MSRMLILGQGVIGTFLGIAFHELSHLEVSHFVRDPARERTSVQLDFHDRRKRPKTVRQTPYHYPITHHLGDAAAADYIVLPVGHDQLRGAVSSLKPYLRPHAVLVIAGNVWQDFHWLEEQLEQPFIFTFPNFGGAIVDDHLRGWLTPRLTTGVTVPAHRVYLDRFDQLLYQAGFRPRFEANIAGWLTTHFAYVGGMMLAAAQADGFVHLSKHRSDLRQMYQLMGECVQLVEQLGTPVRDFPEGRTALAHPGWNATKARLMFLIPGLARSADQGKDIRVWSSYGQALWTLAREHGLDTPLLDAYRPLWED